jgi:RNA polymerase sigma factor (sigma-70 family)
LQTVVELTDEKIMQRVKDGQLSELTTLFERYHVPLYNFFLKLTTDRNASEDLTQTLFYRILRFRHTFNGASGNFRPWMYQMARNIHADYCKQKIRISEIVANTDNEAADIPLSEEGFEEHDYEKLKAAMAALGPVDRELLVLSRYEGLKYAEIAEMKNMSLSAIKVQIHRAMKALRVHYFKQ